jgi:hydroxyacylglutathione hydrolase
MRSRTMGAAVAVLLAVAGGAAVRAGEGDLTTVPRIKLEDFKKDVDAGKLLVIDTRAAEQYAAGHIPGSINVPLAAWAEHLTRLKASRKPIVAYCA